MNLSRVVSLIVRSVGAGSSKDEIAESIDVLDGGGPADLKAVIWRLGGEMLVSTGLAPDLDAAGDQMNEAVASGRARDRFAKVIAAQEGHHDSQEDRRPCRTGRLAR